VSEKEQGLEVVGYLVDLPEEPELGHWFDEEAEEGEQICRHQPLVRQADAERVIDGLRYKTELYDEVWELATCMGFMNVTMALAEVDQLRAALAAVTAERDQSRAEAAQLKNTLLDVTTRHFASSWKRRTDDAELERYLSDGIAQLEAERDQLLAEVEALRSLLQEIGEGCNRRDMPSEAQIAAWATRIDAAMAAKEE
jgi:regulator of replication initiation timing